MCDSFASNDATTAAGMIDCLDAARPDWYRRPFSFAIEETFGAASLAAGEGSVRSQSSRLESIYLKCATKLPRGIHAPGRECMFSL